MDAVNSEITSVIESAAAKVDELDSCRSEVVEAVCDILSSFEVPCRLQTFTSILPLTLFWVNRFYVVVLRTGALPREC